MKYKGKYRVLSHIDQNTNDFPRNENGNIESDDLYIKCSNGSQIYHYGKSILVAYIPSIGRGHNILLAIASKLCGIEGRIDYDKLYNMLEKEGTVRDIVENDKEIEFKFHAKNINFIAEFLKPNTSGADRSPYSTKNLPKSNYTIPVEDLREYKNIVAKINEDNKLLISQITRGFLKDILSKNPLYRTINFGTDMKKKMLKGKEYIHSEGYWNEYLQYLKKRIGE